MFWTRCRNGWLHRLFSENGTVALFVSLAKNAFAYLGHHKENSQTYEAELQSEN